MHRIGYFLTEDFQIMALGTQSVFEFANVVAKEQVYQITNYSLTGGVVTSSIGASVNTVKSHLRRSIAALRARLTEKER